MELVLGWIENVFFSCYLTQIQPFFLQKFRKLQLLLLLKVVAAKAEVKVRADNVDMHQIVLKELVDQICLLYYDRLPSSTVWSKLTLFVLLVLCKNEFAVDRHFQILSWDSFALFMLKMDYLEDSSVKQSEPKGETGLFAWVNARQISRNSLVFALNHAEYFFFINLYIRLSFVMQLLYIVKLTVFLWWSCLKATDIHIVVGPDIDIGWVNAVWVLCL